MSFRSATKQLVLTLPFLVHITKPCPLKHRINIEYYRIISYRNKVKFTSRGAETKKIVSCFQILSA